MYVYIQCKSVYFLFGFMYVLIYPVVKLLLSFARIINLIQYLPGGTVFLL